jgi:hypothetical protein
MLAPIKTMAAGSTSARVSSVSMTGPMKCSQSWRKGRPWMRMTLPWPGPSMSSTL